MLLALGKPAAQPVRRMALALALALTLAMTLTNPNPQPNPDQVRRMAVARLADALSAAGAQAFGRLLRRLPRRSTPEAAGGRPLAAALGALSEACGETCGIDENAVQPWPQSAQARVARARVRARARSTGSKLLRLKAANLAGDGLRGVAAISTLVLVAWRVLG